MDQQKQPRVRLSAALGAPGGVAAGMQGGARAVVSIAASPTALGMADAGVVPGQRSLEPRPEPGTGGAGGRRPGGRLRVDARRNLESVLRAAREVFGELGYGAPMEEVARRAGVGVGTVYRRFPSKEVLVRRIASEEVAWLTVQAREALHGNPDPWAALAGYLARAVATGAGRLLPPEAVRLAEQLARGGAAGGGDVQPAAAPDVASPGVDGAAGPDGEDGADADPAVLLGLLAALVDRAGAAGELRGGVTVADVVLVLTAAVPSYAGPDPAARREPRRRRVHSRGRGRRRVPSGCCGYCWTGCGCPDRGNGPWTPRGWAERAKPADGRGARLP
ncbi:TetR/AcrR family transcriptional regulator [Peterkaempfera sp. SMS 1(5)a]|uniref:TetR/AcrR family transcriptional regulator n=1 Tax=Peterkaempfera podocarpi TaxID=3232308 RepID=UPI00366E7462